MTPYRPTDDPPAGWTLLAFAGVVILIIWIVGMMGGMR